MFSIKNLAFCLAFLASAAFFLTPATAQNASEGRKKATQCQTCHGMDGMAKIPLSPHLAGQPEDYLAKALKDFRAGHRKNEMMSIIVQPLTDKDIADLAAFFASLKQQ